MDAVPSAAHAPRPPHASAPVILAFVGLAAIAIGWFLPWLARGNADLRVLSPAELNQLERDATRESGPGAPSGVAVSFARLKAGEAVSGADLVQMGRFAADHVTNMSPKERRAWTLGLLVARAAPWVAALAAALLAVGRWRRPKTLPLTFVLVVALAALAFAGLIGLGASQVARDAVARDPGALGVGAYAVAAGALAAFLGGAVGGTRTSAWRAWILAILVIVAASAAAIAYVKN